MIHFLEWDSHFFGYKTGLINILNADFDLKQAIKFGKEEGYRLCYAYVPPKLKLINQQSIELGGILVDEKIVFCYDIPPLLDNVSPLSPNIHHFQEATLNSNLVRLSIQSGKFSRFNIDQNFKNQEFERMYTIWMQNAVTGKNDDKVLVYKVGQQIAGVLALNTRLKDTNIEILAVDFNYRRKSIGTQLVERAFEESQLLKSNTIQVVTQKANKIACNFYQKMGFEMTKITNIYHFWL